MKQPELTVEEIFRAEDERERRASLQRLMEEYLRAVLQRDE